MVERICVGSIAGSYGVQGEVRLKSFCAEPTAIADYDPLTNEDGTREFQITLTRPVKNGFGARIVDVKTKEDADALKGVQLFVTREQFPELPDDEFYYADLEGLTVVDTGGAVLGTVKSVQNHGAADLLEIQLPNSSETALLPFTKDAVPTVDLTAKRIVADPPVGIF
ncbi:ribosome maturation factor RimM [Cochlodiniinecator piscidefendens]|uniref:ribosome maturation factor RimM n=1 Tax=Cochlodiniinecator piscidefendens TaxID=2715756 RepID=UPI001407F76A|nr:ribosome maturation factor RimM [Cochlodiniinecator piscidefendens]